MKYQLNKFLFLFPILLILASCGGLNNLTNIKEQTQETQELTTASAKPFNYQNYNSIFLVQKSFYESKIYSHFK